MGKYKFPSGTWFESDMAESEAHNSLKGWAPQLLIHFLRKRQFKKIKVGKKDKRICTNSKSITLTQIEAEKKYGVTQPRFNRAVDDLLAKGFLTIEHQGGAYRQDKTIYAVSENWRIWKPGMVFETREKDPIPRGWRKPKKVREGHLNVVNIGV
jgi:hypothetical protein